MARYEYVVLTKAPPGKEEEFHAWYDDQHMPDCIKVPGVVSAKRWRLKYGVGAGSVVETSEYDSLAIYELETDDPLAIAREMAARAGTADMPLIEGLNRASSIKYVAEAAGECPGEG
jgi:hypothetical protein